MNQFLYDYRPETYRLSLTVSVYVKLKGSVLIMSYPYYKVPKRSLYNETKTKLLFVKECMYKLSRCNITLLPQNLVNKRLVKFLKLTFIKNDCYIFIFIVENGAKNIQFV